jgi:predicted nucleic acid-binding protein
VEVDADQAVGRRSPRWARALARQDDRPTGRPERGQVWGEITTAAQRRGRPRPFNDSWIAACCIGGGPPLLTLNRRDFADFTEHDGLVLLDA